MTKKVDQKKKKSFFWQLRKNPTLLMPTETLPALPLNTRFEQVGGSLPPPPCEFSFFHFTFSHTLLPHAHPFKWAKVSKNHTPHSLETE